MSNQKPLEQLIRKVESDIHKPEIHGDGFIIIWHKKKKEVIKEKGLFTGLLAGKHLDYYFVKSHLKPVVVSKVPLSWHEGTSDISLDFDATFQLKIASKHEAEQLVGKIGQDSTPEKGILRLVDKYLHQGMDNIFVRYKSENKNLLDAFYQQGGQQGESSELDNYVSSQMQQELAGSNFRIGFVLNNAPEKTVFFSYVSDIESTDLTVKSECGLALSNYQSYKKSNIKSKDDIKQYMKERIDNAVKQHILGKSEMELLSNFKNSHDDDYKAENRESSNNKKSIATKIRESVVRDAFAIGYELDSLHTLPDIAPLKLLSGLMITIDEHDASFKTSNFGGSVKLSCRLEVKIVDGEYSKHKHLLSVNEKNNNDSRISYTGTSEQDIIKRLKSPIISICREILCQFDHLAVANQFDLKVKSSLEDALKSRLRSENGLLIDIKHLTVSETEEAARFRELRGRSQFFEFEYSSNNGDLSAPELTIKGCFSVQAISLDKGFHWDRFEGQDYGYRTDSPARSRKLFNDIRKDDTDYDRKCKNRAIDLELGAIEDEIVHLLQTNPAFIVDMQKWVYDHKINPQLQNELMSRLEGKLLDSRGLEIKLENLVIDDKALKDARKTYRKNELENIQARQVKENKALLDSLDKNEVHNQELMETIIKRKKELILDEDEVNSIEELEQQQSKIEENYQPNLKRPTELTSFLPKNQNEKQKKEILNELLGIDDEEPNEN